MERNVLIKTWMKGCCRPKIWNGLVTVRNSFNSLSFSKRTFLFAVHETASVTNVLTYYKLTHELVSFDFDQSNCLWENGTELLSCGSKPYFWHKGWS